MNVIIANKYQSVLQTLNIDIIKSMNGEFEVEEIISTFQNFFFQRMILDITALKNYKDIRTLQKLSISLDMDKVILLLDDSVESSSPDYLSKLISMGIYNFTKNVEGIMYLYNNPNSYRDVAQYHQLDNYTEIHPVAVAGVDSESGSSSVRQTRVIGIKNVTKQSGATTLTYLIKKQLQTSYNVIAVEVDKHDFTYFPDKSLISATSSEIGNVINKHRDADVILVDMNTSGSVQPFLTETIHLVEPTTIKLNKLMVLDPKAMRELKDQKVILNQSILTSKDVLDFEYEAKIKIFYNMPPLDEREHEISILNAFLLKLGFARLQDENLEKRKKILGLF